MIDTHCHLDMCRDPDVAADNDLAAMVTVGISVDRSRAAIELASRHARVHAAIGIHPNSASDALDDDVRVAIETLADDPHVVAIGETGFDTHWEDETLATQREAFDWHADLALRKDLPLILHVRDRQGTDGASRAAAEALRSAGWDRGILHCSNGHGGLLEVGLALGWHVSFAGNLTYKSATDLRDAAAHVPLDRLLVETDSPYLTPEPRRGSRNVPANVRYTAGVLADVRAMAVDDLEAVLDANARRVYGGLEPG